MQNVGTYQVCDMQSLQSLPLDAWLFLRALFLFQALRSLGSFTHSRRHLHVS